MRAPRAGPAVPAGSEAATRWGLSGEGRENARMAFSAAREVPWACVFRLQLPTLLSRQSGCGSSHVRACVIVTLGLATDFPRRDPAPALVCLVWPGGMFALASGAFPLADWSLLFTTDMPGGWLARPP